MTLFRNDLLKLKDAKLVVYGDLMVDEYWRGSVTRVSPEGAFPVFNRQGSPEYWLGGAGSALQRARQLDANAQFVGVAGTGPMSDMAVGLMRQIGADVEHIVRYPNAGVSVKTRLLDPLGHQCLTRLDHDWQLERMEASVFRLLADALGKARLTADWILVSDYGKGMVTESIWDELRRQGWKIVVDGKGPWERYAGAEVLQVNRAAYEQQCGRGGKHNAVGYMVSNDIRHVVLTGGKNGMHLLDQDGRDLHYYTPGREEPPLSITGAGDQVAASLTSALAAGMGIAEACQFAHLSASLAVRMGGIPTLTNLAQRLPISGGPDFDTMRFHDWDGSMERFTAQVRLGGQELVFCNGIYDLFHAAHEFFLRRAREQAPNPFVLVALNSDKSAKSIKRQPVIAEEHRAQIVKACRHVDAVCIFDEQTPKALIEAMKPDVYVTPSDHGANSVTAKLVRRLGGDVTVLPRGADCTTDIIRRIKGRKR